MDGPNKTAEEIMEEIQDLRQTIDGIGSEDTALKELKEQLHQEIEDHKRDNEGISEERNKLQSILGATQNGVTIRDLDYTLTYQNYVVTKIYGDRTGQKCYRVFEGQEQVCQGCPVELAFKDGQSHASVREVVSPSGETAYWQNIANPIKDANDKVVSCVEISTNITERKQAEKESLLHSEVTNNMAEGVYLISAEDGIIIWANPKFEKMFGYDAGEMNGQHAFIVNTPTEKDPQETASEIMEVLNQTGQWCGEVNNIKKDGTNLWCSANCSIFNHPEYGRVIVAVHTDITGRKRVEEQLRESEEKFRSLVRNVPGVTYRCRCDEHWTMEFISDEIEILSGYPAKDFIQNKVRSYASIISSEDQV